MWLENWMSFMPCSLKLQITTHFDLKKKKLNKNVEQLH